MDKLFLIMITCRHDKKPELIKCEFNITRNAGKTIGLNYNETLSIPIDSKISYKYSIDKEIIGTIFEYNKGDVNNYMLEIISYESDLEKNKELAILKFTERLKFNSLKLQNSIEAADNL